MKQLQNSGAGWLELKQIALTDAQRAIYRSEDDEARLALIQELKAQREVAASEPDAAIAQAAYEKNKPVLKGADTYQLIAVDVTVAGDTCTGIINCRVNGEHVQVRF